MIPMHRVRFPVSCVVTVDECAVDTTENRVASPSGSLRDREYGTVYSIWYRTPYICVKAVPVGQKDQTDPSVGRSRVRECGTSGHAAAH